MTIVAIWYEPTDDVLWAVADTRISAEGEMGVYIRTDSAAKLLSLPIACRMLSNDPSVELIPFYTTTYGFTYSGNPTLALMTFANASAILQQLTSISRTDPPRLREVVQVVQSLAVRYLTEAWKNDQNYPGFECAVFGYCPHSTRFEIYHFVPTAKVPVVAFSLTETCPINDSQIVVFGSGKNDLLEEISKIRINGDVYGRKARSPKLAIELMIETNKNLTVGGSLSIGIATRYRFQQYAWVSPLEKGKPHAKRAFNGIDLDSDIVGASRYFVGTPGMV